MFSIEEKPDQVLELDEPFDLRAPGVEILTVVSRERRFPIQVDEQNFTVKGPFITGAKLLELVGKTPGNHFVTQVLVGVDDIVIGPGDRVDLTVPGREHFTIVAKPRENDHKLTVEVFSPRFPDKPKSFTWAKTMKVGDAAREAATAFGYVGGSPGLQTIVPPPGAGRVLDSNKQLIAENLKDGDQLEIVDTGGGV